MAAKLIDLSFTLNGRKVKVQIAPDTMLFSLLREQGCASVRCACETTNCGLCTVWLDGDPVLSCSVPAARVEGRSITTLEGRPVYTGDMVPAGALIVKLTRSPAHAKAKRAWCRGQSEP